MNEKFSDDNTASWFIWLWDEAKVLAPKVSLLQIQREGNNAQLEVDDRGIFASDDILPNERIMFIPSSACLSAQTLQTRAGQIFQEQQNQQSDISPQHQMELDAICAIQDIKSAAEQSQCTWRDDDSVALYLIACWNILWNPSYAQTNKLIMTSIAAATTDIAPAEEGITLAEAVINAHQPTIVPTIENSSDSIPAVAYVLGCQEDYTQDDSPSMVCAESFVSFLPHCQMLPRLFHNPLYFTDDELKLIEGTNCHAYSVKMKQQIYQDWEELLNLIEYWWSSRTSRGHNYWFLSVQDISFQLYLWAYSNIYSRSTDLDASSANFCSETEEGEYDCSSSPTSTIKRILVPLLDMLNHDFSSELVHSIDEYGNISVFNGPSTIREGEEICLNYGHFSNEKLLLVYGFTVDPNSYNHVNIYAPLPSEDPLYPLKVKILQKCHPGINPDGPHSIQVQNIANSGDSILPPSLVSSLRLIGLQCYDTLLSIVSQQDTEVNDADDDSGAYYQLPMIHRDNECSALTALQEALHSMARQLALNLICDENLNAANSVQGDKENHFSHVSKLHLSNARRLCWGEYEILQMALAEVHHRLEVLEEEREEIFNFAEAGGYLPDSKN